MRKLISLSLVLLLSPVLAGAEAWNIAGSRALGMGGAFTAVAEGPIAQQWNPAGLAKKERDYAFDFLIYGGAGYRATRDMLEGAKQASDIVDDVQDIINRFEADQTGNLKDLQTASKSMAVLDTLFDGRTSILAHINAGAGFKIKNLAVSLNNYSTISGRPVIDLANLALTDGGHQLDINPAYTPTPANQGMADQLAAVITAAGALEALKNVFGISAGVSAQDIANSLVYGAEASGYTTAQMQEMINAVNDNLADASGVINTLARGVSGSYNDNMTSVIANASAFTELAVGYGHGFFEGALKAGANVKVIRGDLTGAQYRVFFDNREFADVIDDAWKDKETSYQPAVDLGLNLELNKVPGLEFLPFSPQFGLSGRNLNSPKFKRPLNQGDYKFDAQYRAGLAVRPFNPWLIAADIDLTENNTQLADYQSRQLALGTEINLVNGRRFNLPLRLGIMKNIAAGDDDLMFTGGIGLLMAVVNIELAGAVSTGSENIDGNKVPRQAGAALNVSFLF